METHVHNESDTHPTQAPVAARPAPRLPVVTPRVDIYENDHEILLLLDLHGVAPGEVQLAIDRGELTLTATTPLEHPLGPVRYERAFLVPRGVHPDGVQADLRNGVLKVTLPKGEGSKRRTVEVSGA